MPTTQRQHRSPDGVWRRCQASVRACSFAEHRGGVDGGASAATSAGVVAISKYADHDAAPALPFELLGPRKEYDRWDIEEVRLAPSGSSGKFCKYCHRYLSIKQWAKLDEDDTIRCPSCRREMSGNELSVDFRSDELRFLNDGEVRSNHWFHISHHEDWDGRTKERKVLTHLGSKEAAMERLFALQAQSLDEYRRAKAPKRYYLHEVRVNSDARIAPGLYSDQLNTWPETRRGSSRSTVSIKGQDALRYMNEYEGPGTVSLLADPKAYALVASVLIPAAART